MAMFTELSLSQPVMRTGLFSSVTESTGLSAPSRINARTRQSPLSDGDVTTVPVPG